MKSNSKSYDQVYRGLALIGRQFKKCRSVYRQGKKVLIEFEDKRRDWCFPNEIQEPTRKLIGSDLNNLAIFDN